MNNFGKRIKAILKDIDKIELQPINTTFLQESIPKGDIYIECTDNIHNLRIRLSGNGTITIRDGSTIELTNKIKQIEVHPRYVSDEGISVVEIFGVENIHTLEITHDADDLLANSIRKLEFNNITNNINKLVLNNNNIEELDLTLCKELQFLHMFNNPICYNRDSMWKLIDSLPDRNNKPFGSIIMYDWVNLGLCGHRNTDDSLFYYDTEYKYPIRTYENEIYRDIDSIEHPWYQYIDNTFVELSDYNNLIMIRRELEGLDKSSWTYTNKRGSIFKNWVFGSAIQYNEEAWKYCDIPFRNAHIADVWETAEKGEGVGITSEDRTRFNTVNINFSRVLAYSHPGYPNDGNQDNTATTGNVGIAPVPIYNTEDEIPDVIKSRYPWLQPGCFKLFPTTGATTATGNSHGDMCYSFMGSRGLNSVHKDIYGVAPESRYYLYSLNSNVKGGNTSWAGQNDYRRMISRAVPFDESKINRTSRTSSTSIIDSVNLNDINILTRSLGNFAKYDENTIDNDYHWQSQMCTEIFKYMSAFNSQGNSGDGIPFTTDQGIDSGADVNNPAQLGAYTMGEGCYWVSSLNRSKEPSVYSSNDRSDKPFTHSYICYGESVRLVNSSYKKIMTSGGTSFATPLHAAETALLRVIFSKLNNCYRYNENTNYWYCENALDIQEHFKMYADNHLDHLYQYGRSAVGLGTIDMLFNSPYSVSDSTNTFTSNTKNEIDVGHVSNIYQITEKSDTYSVNDGHYGYADINSLVFANKRHTAVVPLNEGTHAFKVYNNHRNIIEDSSTTFGITDDVSENKWWSSSELKSVHSDNYACVTDELLYDNSEYGDVSVITDTNKGWTVSFALQYKRDTNTASRTLLCSTDDFSIATSINTQTTREKVALKITEHNTDMESDKGYSYIATDCWLNDNTTHRYTGYLGDVKDHLFVFTIVKEAQKPVYSFYINGQYITSHTASDTPNYKGTLSGFKVLPTRDVDGNSYGNKHFSCSQLCIHNKPLTITEIIANTLYMLSDKEAE